MIQRVAGIAWFVVACGQSELPAPDAAADGAVSDAPTDAAVTDVCWSKHFGTPTPVPGINVTGREGGLRLSPDELTAYFDVPFADDGGGGIGLAMATRTSRNAAFGAPQPVPGILPVDQHNYMTPTVSDDGRTLILYEDYAGSRLLRATRPSSLDVFGPLAVVGGTAAGDTLPFISGDALYWTNKAYGVMRGQLGVGGVTGATSVDLISFNEWFATVSGDQLTIFFATNCSDCGPSVGDWDVWVASRASAADAFGTATDVIEVNTAAVDFPTWISPDGCRLYLQSARDSNAGGVWMAAR